MTDTVRETFTLDLLGWSPWLDRATDTDLTPEQRDAVVAFIGNAPNTDYINVLSNDLESVKARALVHRHVYTDDEPWHSANRELGATTTSRINGCVFCASVHARMYANYSKQRDVIQRFLDDGLDADLPPPPGRSSMSAPSSRAHRNRLRPPICNRCAISVSAIWRSSMCSTMRRFSPTPIA